MADNKVVKQAIEVLIKEYNANTHKGNSNSCSLCKIFHIKYDSKQMECSACPNAVFNSYYGCVYRGDKYPNLDYDKKDHRQLINYWIDVLALIPDSDETFCVDDLEKKIIAIAEKRNKY